MELVNRSAIPVNIRIIVEHVRKRIESIPVIHK
jgi:hypothetical protein